MRLNFKRATDTEVNRKFVYLCAWCGLLRVDKQGWVQPQEVLIHNYQLSHTICPYCTTNYFADYEEPTCEEQGPV